MKPFLKHSGIADDAQFGAVVTKDITEAGIYAGNPARLIRRLP